MEPAAWRRRMSKANEDSAANPRRFALCIESRAGTRTQICHLSRLDRGSELLPRLPGPHCSRRCMTTRRGCTAASSPSPAATSGCSRRRPALGRGHRDARPRGRGRSRRQGAGAAERHRRAARARLVRAARCRCGSTASTRTTATATSSTSSSRPATQLDTIMIPKAGVRRRRAPRRDAARPDRGGGRAARIGSGISVLIETAIGMVNVDEIATRLPGADGGDGLRRRRLRRLDAEPHDLDRRRRPGLRRADRRERRRPSASATGATSGTTRCPGSP